MATTPPIRTVTPYLAVHNCAEAIDFYMRAFGAIERYRIMGDGTAANADRIGHVELIIGETVIYMSDEAPEWDAHSPRTLKGAAVAFVMDVEDVDLSFQQAIDAGAKEVRPISDAPYGRGGWVVDPYGYRWNIMTGNPDFDPASMAAPSATEALVH